MKRVCSVLVLSVMVSACGTSISSKPYSESYSSYEAPAVTANIDVAKQWGDAARWETTPDGYPMW